MIDKNRLVRLTQKIVQINSENPPGNEYRLARFVADKLRSCGLTVKFYEFAKGRTNVVGILKGNSGRKSLLLSPHLDTVPAGKGWKVSPFSGKVVKGRIYGRGATDCKGNLAVGLEVLRSLTRERLRLKGDIIFAATADEETGSGLGIIPLLRKGIIKPSAAVILDSDDFDIIVAQKGLIHFKIKIFGKQAHGAYPHLGVNAIEIAAGIIGDLKKYKFLHSPHPLLRPPTINIGTIKGGDKVNMVADHCEFEVDLRFLPGMKVPAILQRIKSLISKRTKKFKVEINGIQEPCQMKRKHPLVRTLADVNRKLIGRVRLKGSEGATVISFFLKKGIPALATGFGKRGTAHATNEYAVIDDLYKGAQVLEEFIKRLDRIR